jgi:hypothetical protein
MIIEIIALTVSVVAVVAQGLTMREQNRKWDEYFENERKRKQKQSLVQLMQDDERDGMYEDEIENKIKGTILLKPKEQ